MVNEKVLAVLLSKVEDIQRSLNKEPLEDLTHKEKLQVDRIKLTVIDLHEKLIDLFEG